MATVPLQVTTNPALNHPFAAMLRRYTSLNNDDLAALARLLDRKLAVKKGKDIIVEGYEYNGLHIVESGFAVRYKLLHNGGRQLVSIVLPGDIIEFPACFFKRAVFSAMAIRKMSLHYIPLRAFADLCRQRPSIATAMIWFAAGETALHVEHIVDTGRRAPLERLAHFLLETHARLQTVGCASESSFEMPLSQESIGDAVGLSAPHVNRMLRELRTDELIAMDGHEIRILDRAALQILGQFESSYLARSPIPDCAHNRLPVRPSGSEQGITRQISGRDFDRIRVGN
jgi:CRP-like cAMP-binding protein